MEYTESKGCYTDGFQFLTKSVYDPHGMVCMIDLIDDHHDIHASGVTDLWVILNPDFH